MKRETKREFAYKMTTSKKIAQSLQNDANDLNDKIIEFKKRLSTLHPSFLVFFLFNCLFMLFILFIYLFIWLLIYLFILFN